jgi:antitoxin component YwqK of YwqJK toxin-antitoxin module
MMRRIVAGCVVSIGVGCGSVKSKPASQLPGESTTLVGNLENPVLIGTDARWVFFIDRDRVLRVAIDGGDPTVIAQGSRNIVPIGVADGFVYFQSPRDAIENVPARVFRVPSIGGATQQVAQIAADTMIVAAAQLYWIDNSSDAIMSTAISDGRPAQLASLPRDESSFRLAADERYLYLLTQSDVPGSADGPLASSGRLVRIDQTTGKQEGMALGVCDGPLAVDDEHVFVDRGLCSASPALLQSLAAAQVSDVVLRIDKRSLAQSVVLPEAVAALDPAVFSTDDSHLYYRARDRNAASLVASIPSQKIGLPVCPPGSALSPDAGPPKALQAYCVDAQGQHHGPARGWHVNGTVAQDSNYQHGKLHGVQRTISFAGEVTEQQFVDGVENGRFQQMSTRGRPVQQGKMVVGRRAAMWEEFDEQGRIEERGNYVADKREGTWTAFWLTGVVSKEQTFHNGAINGPARYFHPSGKLAAEGSLVNGQRDGVWRSFDANSANVHSATYRSGELVSVERDIYQGARHSATVSYQAHQSQGCDQHAVDPDHGRGRRQDGRYTVSSSLSDSDILQMRVVGCEVNINKHGDEVLQAAQRMTLEMSTCPNKWVECSPPAP